MGETIPAVFLGTDKIRVDIHNLVIDRLNHPLTVCILYSVILTLFYADITFAKEFVFFYI